MRRWIPLAVAAVLVAATAVLYWVPPTAGGFYPRCMFHVMTGLHCPGCGSTRCVHALLHGNVHQAAAYNLLLVLLLPVLLTWGMRVGFRALLGSPNPFRPVPTWAIHLVLVLMAIFGIARNLPFAPFSLLAPHELP